MYSWEETTDWSELKSQGTLAVDKAFYEICAKPAIHEKFPQYEGRIACGLVGEGSECFGFDDSISRDHDFALGFCMWISSETMWEAGTRLQQFYDDLMEHEGAAFSEHVWGENHALKQDRVQGRRGVMVIDQFYANILRLNFGMDKLIDGKYWCYAEPRFLATATNGEVWRDDEGAFTRARKEILNFYPQQTYYFKLAEQLHLFSHGGQSNYPRMMARKDYVTAHICIDMTIQAAMQIAYLLDRKFPPYYKWTRRGLQNLSILPQLSEKLEELAVLPLQKDAWEGVEYSSVSVNMKDAAIAKIEEISSLLAKELMRQGFTDNEENFLEAHVQEIAAKAQR